MGEGVRLRRNTAKMRGSALFVALLGACGWGAALGSAADPTSAFNNSGPFMYASAAMFLGAALALVALFWSFYIDIDEAGMTVRTRGATTRLPWSSVEMLTAVQIGTDWSNPVLEIQVAPGARIRRRFNRRNEGRRVYGLESLENFTLPPEQVVAILDKFSGGKVDAQDYLNYRAGKRAVVQWLTEQQRIRDRPDDETGEGR
ncbi:hypothetical protein [Micromonospora cathayae]|uniref:PH domain-containing protein n=1 Tax=Micromonospora cathayae TaxID=3028804 RepID=A0ABY7ZNF3_9ACTN|nr:hypothetical protein [Micromonospora sp. HUAS 3]WDZ83966.1 hypothetical protein PVK37_26420 [Micromonospora sp. HUAS 3]